MHNRLSPTSLFILKLTTSSISSRQLDTTSKVQVQMCPTTRGALIQTQLKTKDLGPKIVDKTDLRMRWSWSTTHTPPTSMPTTNWLQTLACNNWMDLTAWLVLLRSVRLPITTHTLREASQTPSATAACLKVVRAQVTPSSLTQRCQDLWSTQRFSGTSKRAFLLRAQ